MKFILSNGDKGLKLPYAALKLSGLGEEERLELRILEGTAVLLPTAMTAMELLRAAGSLNELASELLTELACACGPCGDCGLDGTCDAQRPDGTPRIRVPDWALRGAGIPEDAKLVCDVDEGTVHIVRADFEHDLSDVPPQLLKALRDAGVCMAELEELLMAGDVVCGMERSE